MATEKYNMATHFSGSTSLGAFIWKYSAYTYTEHSELSLKNLKGGGLYYTDIKKIPSKHPASCFVGFPTLFFFQIGSLLRKKMPVII